MSKKQKASILVVDDNKELVESICAQFTYCGFEVIKAFDPLRAFELASVIRPDVIIADIRMPKLDGISLIKKFKSVQPDVRVILMTGYYPDYEESIKNAIKSGLADKVIQKRFHTLDLEKLVYEILKSPSEDRLFSNNAKAKILVVDDEVEVTDFLRDFFMDQGYAVSVARSADEAMVVYETFEPNVVITDIKMPSKDGFWLIDKLRDRDKKINFFVMTGQDSHEMVQRIKQEAGIEKYLTKPFGLRDLEKLQDMIRGLVEKKGKK